MKEAQGNILDIQLPCTRNEIAITGKSEYSCCLSRRTIFNPRTEKVECVLLSAHVLGRFSESPDKSSKAMDKF